MRRTLHPLAATLALALLFGCEREPVAPTLSAPRPASDISDAVHGLDGNPGFFWLAPMVAQPASELLGTFAPRLRPTVKVVCQEVRPVGGECDPAVALMEVGVGSGLVVDAEKYQVDIDIATAGLRPVSEGDTATYRILVLTDSLVEVGGPFVVGFADIQVASSGREARNLATGDVIGLVDDRTLPVKFRLEGGAYEHELRTNLATVPGDPTGPLCQENCTVEVVPNTETTEVSLREEDGGGEEVTGVLFEAGDLATTSIVIIDEKRTDGDDADCAAGVHLQKRYCYRYKVFPDVSFQNEVRVGICPRELPIGAGSPWALLKVDYDAAGVPTLTRPVPVGVADFLPCVGLGGDASALRSAFHRALEWLVPPLYAATEKVWGGMASDFSDLFWGIEAELTPVSAADTTAAPGDVVVRTVAVHATNPEPDEALEGAHVAFEITSGEGSLAAPTGVTAISSDTAIDGRTIRLTLATAADGQASVEWTLGPGENRMEVTSPHATTADGQPVIFTATAGEADLTVTEVSPRSSGTGMWTIRAIVQNIGPAPAGAYSYQLDFVSLETGERIQTLPSLRPPLAPGAADTVSATPLLPAGTWEITATANGDSAVIEDDFANNSARSTLAVGAPLQYTAVASGMGGNYSCALDGSGSAWCWGENSRGQLAIASSPLDCAGGTFECELRPRAAETSLAFQRIDAGAGHGCGVDGAGKAWCWGMNQEYQLGIFDTSDQPAPVAVLDPIDPATGLPQAVTYQRVSTGRATTCGRTTAGAIFCWGYGDEGMAGNGVGGTTARPRQVSEDSLGAAVFTEVDVGFTAVCALGSDGRPYCWGDNRYGQAGQLTGQTCTFSRPCAPLPRPVAAAPTLTQITVGFAHACGLDELGGAWCWGENLFGTLGSETTEICEDSRPCSRTPKPVSGSLTFAHISAGFRHTCAVTTGGETYCWGSGQGGALGDGSTTSRPTPVRTADPVIPAAHTVSYAAVAPGNAHTCALTQEGAVYCWGTGSWGELGRGEDPRSPDWFPGKHKPARVFEPRP